MLNHDYNTWQGTTCYNENQLKKVTDTASDPLYQGAFHFQDGGNVAVEYLYDTNGNMTVDYNKKISKIQYNQLNLPNKLQFTYGHTTSYRYGADGTKRNATHVTSTTNLLVPMGSIVAVPVNQIASTMQTDYCGNLIYENGVLSKILTEEGYITLNGTTPVYHYYLKDYQGNNRVVIDQSGVVEQVNHYYPFGMTYGDGIATSNQPYKYNGKELDRMHGLDWYDYGARFYDPALGRWHSVDPKADWYYSMSPYNYAANNPIILKDPNGQWIETAWDAANVVMGVKSFISNVRQGNVGSAILDGVGVVVDAAAVVLPVIPGGAGAGIKAYRAADNAVDAAQSVKTADKGVDAMKNRVKLQKDTKEAIKDAAPKTRDGSFIDPNTGKPIEKGQEVYGHKTGEEWSKYKKDPANQDKTRKEVIKDQNDPIKYQIEDK
nr:RHS repeat-associated core domain-containing protein [uncultured Macellibacteroides sp.]